MAIFSRRTLQRTIEGNLSFLRPDQVLRHVAALNDSSQDVVAAEWEIVLLNAFSRFGTVVHEPDLGGTTKPDILFTPFHGTRTIAIDVATVSDKGLEKLNPYDALSKELKRRIRNLRRRGVLGGFSLQVGASSLNVFRGSAPTRLKLPRPHRFGEVVFNEGFQRFVDQIIARPQVAHAYSVKNDEADVSITYEPQVTGLSGTHVSYTSAHSKRRNPVANALRAKAGQLKRSGFRGPFGIVLCDGGCDMLRRDMYDWSSYNLEEVIREFFRRHSSVAFVLTIRVRRKGLLHIDPEHLRVEGRLYHNKSAGEVDAAITKCVAKIPTLLPLPLKDATNARHFLDWLRGMGRWNQGESLYGGVTVSDRMVKISARAVLELLAGRVDQTVFFNAHSFGQHNPFRRELEQGRLITKVVVEKSAVPEDDDDWLLFEFGEADAAVAPFKVPREKKTP